MAAKCRFVIFRSIQFHLILSKLSHMRALLYLHVNVVNSVSDVLEDRLERHEEIAVLEAVIDSGK